MWISLNFDLPAQESSAFEEMGMEHQTWSEIYVCNKNNKKIRLNANIKIIQNWKICPNINNVLSNVKQITIKSEAQWALKV